MTDDLERWKRSRDAASDHDPADDGRWGALEKGLLLFLAVLWAGIMGVVVHMWR